MQKSNFYSDNPDIAFQLSKRMDFDAVFELISDAEKEAVGATTAQEYKDTWLEVLDTLGEVCGTEIAPNAAQVEKEDLVLKDGEVILPPTLASNLKTLIEVGISASGIAPEYDGLGSPFFIEVMSSELMNRACPSTAITAIWFASIAAVLEHFASKELAAEIVPHMAAGEWSGSMALTEADAGSDLANIRTYAEDLGDGKAKIFGSKTFISNGCGQVCLLLAKNKKGAKGLKDLNLYCCLKKIGDKENFKVTKLEEKIALHGSATCEMTFDASEAWLIGKDGEGLKYMFTLMNEARIAVAYQGLGQMEAAWRAAKEFAGERKTWGKPIAEHELIAEKLLDMEVDVKGIRSLAYQASWNMTMAMAAEKKIKKGGISEEETKKLKRIVAKHTKRVRRWTPLLKYYVGERSFDHARNGVQIHGGYGFSKEYRAEAWLRESLILSIYEGTSQIQALMCVKDTIKDLMKNPKEFIEVGLGYKFKALAAGDPIRRKLSRAKQLSNSAVISVIFRLLKTNARESYNENQSKDILKVLKIVGRDLMKFEDISVALLHAERLTEMKSITAVAETLVWDYEADPSRRWVAERYLNKGIQRLKYLKGVIEMDDPVILDKIAGRLEDKEDE